MHEQNRWKRANPGHMWNWCLLALLIGPVVVLWMIVPPRATFPADMQEPGFFCYASNYVILVALLVTAVAVVMCLASRVDAYIDHMKQRRRHKGYPLRQNATSRG